MNAHFHTRLAEAYYTQGKGYRPYVSPMSMLRNFDHLLGGYDHLVLARKHYSSSLTMLAPEVNLRALYGLVYVCRAIASDSSADSEAKRT
jgi:hypothetical protein